MKFDCFTFYNESDLLEMRLEELDPVVDFFVMAEGNKTFAGADKPYWFYETGYMRFKKYEDKIIWLPVDLPANVSAWEREFFQRNALVDGIKQAGLDDWILLSDVDEIPRRSAVEALGRDYNDWAYTIDLPAYYGALNVYGGHSHSTKAIQGRYLPERMQDLRRMDVENHIPNGGWHFSYLGNEEFIRNKIQSYAHTELNTPSNTDLNVIANRLANRRNLWGTGEANTVVPIDDTWPEAYKRDPKRWERYVCAWD